MACGNLAPASSGQLDLNRVGARSLALQFPHQFPRTGSLFARVGPTPRRVLGVASGLEEAGQVWCRRTWLPSERSSHSARERLLPVLSCRARYSAKGRPTQVDEAAAELPARRAV